MNWETFVVVGKVDKLGVGEEEGVDIGDCVCIS